MKRFTRLAMGFSKELANLESAVHLHMAYYNFCWRPGKMRITRDGRWGDESALVVR